jgi:glycosyltransferase involved in cell wall biosynthesis
VRILQLCNKAPYPANDGSSIAIYNMAQGLLANHVELHLLTINTKKHFKPTEEVPKDFVQKSNYQAVFKNTNTSFFGLVCNLFSTKSYFESRFYFPEFEAALIKKLQESSFDVIQLEGLFMTCYIETIRKNSNSKIVLRAHNIEHLIWERHIVSEKNPLKKAYLNLQKNRLKNSEIQALKNVDGIIPITSVDEKWIKQAIPNSLCKTILTGINLSEYSTQKGPNFIKKSVFFFGSMDWLPNQQAVFWFLDNCWELILEEIPECVFIIAGRNIPSHIKQLESPQILIKENVAEAKEIYSNYNIMLAPLQSGSGLRIKIVEGLAHGKAIVSTDIGAEGIPIQSNETIFLANDPKEFVDKITKLLSNEALLSKIETGARRFAEEHLDNQKITEELVRFYKELV